MRQIKQVMRQIKQVMLVTKTGSFCVDYLWTVTWLEPSKKLQCSEYTATAAHLFPFYSSWLTEKVYVSVSIPSLPA